MSKEEKYELIESYLEGKLSGDELDAFEKQMKDSEELRREVELHRQLEGSIKGEKMHELRSTLKQVDREWKQQETAKVVRMKLKPLFRLSAIAAAILIFLFTYQFIIAPGKTNTGELYADNFQPYQMMLSQRSVDEESEIQSLLNQGISAYQNENFKEAAKSFGNLYQQNDQNISYLFYSAVSELAIENTGEAIRMLTEVVDAKGHLYMEQASWFLGLAYLQAGDKVRAKETLANITKGQFKYKEAQQILANIR